MRVVQDRLQNGAGLLLVHDKNCPSVTVMAIVAAGSRNEVPEQSGIAHVIEHNLFKGTRKRPSSRIMSFEVENLGAYQNAYTSKESTRYYIKGPRDKVRSMMEILSDMLHDPLFKEEELEKEKKVIIEEIKMYEDIPQYKVFDHFLERMFPHSQLGSNIAGTVDTVSAISVADCRDFMSKHYLAGNLLLVISGNFQEQDVKAWADDYFGALPAGKPAPLEQFKQNPLKNKVNQFAKKIEQTHIILGGYFQNYQLPYEKRVPLYLGRTLLTGGMGSRLSLRIREDLGLAYYIGMGLKEFRETGYYYVEMGVDHAKVAEAVDAVLDELRKFKAGDVSITELERAKNLVVGNFTTSFETSDEVAGWYGNQILEGQKRIISLEEAIALIRKTTKKQILDAWEAWLTNDNLLAVTLGSEKPVLNVPKL